MQVIVVNLVLNGALDKNINILVIAWILLAFYYFKHPHAHKQQIKRQVKTQFDSLEFSADNVNKTFIEKENNLTNLQNFNLELAIC